MDRKLFLILFFLCLNLLSKQAFAWSILTDDLDVHCHQVIKILNCKYRILTSELASSINAISDDAELQVTEENQYPENNDITAILFLVDTSDPGRQNVIEKNKTHIKELLTGFKSHHKVGLATFDKSLQIKSPARNINIFANKITGVFKSSRENNRVI